MLIFLGFKIFGLVFLFKKLLDLNSCEFWFLILFLFYYQTFLNHDLILERALPKKKKSLEREREGENEMRLAVWSRSKGKGLVVV